MFPRHGSQKLNYAIRQRHIPWFARFGNRHTPLTALQVKLFPFSVQHLTLTGTRQDQHGNDVLEHGINTGLYRTIQHLGFCLRQIPLFLVSILKQRNVLGWVLSYPWNFPSNGKIHGVAQQNQAAVSRTQSQPLSLNAMMKSNHVMLGDLVQVLLAKHRQQVISGVAVIADP